MNIFALAGTIGQIISILPGLIRAVEEIFPGENRGAEKMESVLGSVRETLEQIPELADKAAELAEEVKPIVSGIVDTFNNVGVFGEPDETAPEAPRKNKKKSRR